MECIAPGIWKIRLGQPEAITPSALREELPRLRELADLDSVSDCPIAADTLVTSILARGTVVEIPIADAGGAENLEQFYGLGLQLKSFNQTGLKKTLRVNSDPIADTGDSHAPVPFFVSTAGYGIYVDTARYASFYLGSHAPRNRAGQTAAGAAEARNIGTSTEELYAQRKLKARSILVDVPGVRGVDIYVFAGPTMMQAVQRYNLYAGGGCLPPRWGLGIWYRAHGKSTQEQIGTLAAYFREKHIPCDVLGLEPGWQTHAYPCSYVWSRERFPDPAQLMAHLREQGYQINLWEHVFVHPSSPLYVACAQASGNYEVWGGLVPDLLMPQTRAAFADYHRQELIEQGISGFKLDECDNSDFIKSPWSFPEVSVFPSGADGEQMHTLLGIQYQRTLYGAFKTARGGAEGVRTYSEVRSSGAWAAPYPFVLYSDLYEHRDFIRGLVNAGFSGLLWTPEVRDARSPEELIRRLQTAVFSPQTLVNAWYIQHPPWLQVETEKNCAGQFFENAAEWEAVVRKLFQLRMRLLPYLYAAFARYYLEGVPAFRALVLDTPQDQAVWGIDDEYLVGDELLVAPLFTGQKSRQVYLPRGQWYGFDNHQRYEGGTVVTVEADLGTIPVFVRSGAILPVAQPVEHVTSETVFEITPQAYGPEAQRRAGWLFDDDGQTYLYQRGDYVRIKLGVDQQLTTQGTYKLRHYRIGDWCEIT